MEKEEQEQEQQDQGSVTGFFSFPPGWKEVWRGMPSFNQEDLTSFQAIKVHFRNLEDRAAFAKACGLRVTDTTQSLWYPQMPFADNTNKRWVTRIKSHPVTVKYPIYVISKGRWESRLTVKALDLCDVPYHVVIEPQEYDQYAAVIDPAKILKLPFSNLGQGSIPARNWVWEHAISRGASRHWILDDNIRCFYRLYNNDNIRVACPNIFRVVEDLADRYTNVALAGFNYFMFVPRKNIIPPFYLNTRVYSCILIKNDLPYRWRGRYNEDTDLSLCALEDGWCTILLNAISAEKKPTMTMKGGNTDQLYQDDGRLKMAKSLQEQHPKVVKVSRKWDRWQHQVDYSRFSRNKLILKPGMSIRDEPNEYNMILRIEKGEEKEEVVEAPRQPSPRRRADVQVMTTNKKGTDEDQPQSPTGDSQQATPRPRFQRRRRAGP